MNRINKGNTVGSAGRARTIKMYQRKAGYLASIGNNNTSVCNSSLYGFLMAARRDGFNVEFVDSSL